MDPFFDPLDVTVSAPDAQDNSPPGEKDKPAGVATRLVNYVLTPALGVELFLDHAGVAYITAPVEGIRQTWLIDSEDCRLWLTRVFYACEEAALSGKARTDVIALLQSQARFGKVVHKVFVRVAAHAGAIYLDLGGADWRAARILPGTWDVVTQPPVKFRRPRGLQTLPPPDPTASLAALDVLRAYLNVKSEESWLSILAWVTHALLPHGPYALLFLTGQPGVAKTTASRVVRSLIDPVAASVRDAPQNQRDFAIAAHNNWVLALDNLSHIPEWLSDALCRLSTGGGFATRQLYTNTEEIQFDFCRPAVINAIEDIITRSDLLQRLLTVELMPISEKERLKEEDFWKSFGQDRPRILGGLLTLTAQALALKGTFQLASSPRVADFCHWGEAVARTLGHPPGRFAQILQANAANAATVTLDATPLFGALERYLARFPSFVGTASGLLTEVERTATEPEKRHAGWPRTANKLSGILRRIAANLKQAGIEYCTLPRTGSAGRQIAVWNARRMPPTEVIKAGLLAATPGKEPTAAATPAGTASGASPADPATPAGTANGASPTGAEDVQPDCTVGGAGAGG